MDTFIGTGKYQTGRVMPISRCPTSRPTTCWRQDRRARTGRRHRLFGQVFVSERQARISTTDQREEGFKTAMGRGIPRRDRSETQFNDNDANKGRHRSCRACLPATPT